MTISFRYPYNVHYNINLIIHNFSKYVCKLIGAVHDCYILQSRFSNGEFHPFDASTDLKVVADSYKKEHMVDENRIVTCSQLEDYYENMVKMHEGIDDEYGSNDES